MEYKLDKNRLVNIIDEIIHQRFPNFNKDYVWIENPGSSSKIRYRDDFSGELFATYYKKYKTLELEPEILDILEISAGNKIKNFVLYWFNEEFSQDAVELLELKK